MNLSYKILILSFIAFQINAMDSNIQVCDSDSGDEPAILSIIREDRDVLIRRPNFDEVAMITRKSLTPEDEKTYGSLNFKVLKDKNTVLGFTAHHATDLNKIQIALVAIDKKYRGKKNAQKLLAETVFDIRNKAKDPVTIWAYVRKDNVAAKQIWQKTAGAIPNSTLNWEEGTGRANDAYVVSLH